MENFIAIVEIKFYTELNEKRRKEKQEIYPPRLYNSIVLDNAKYFSAAEKDSFADFTVKTRFEKIFNDYCSGCYNEFKTRTLGKVFDKELLSVEPDSPLLIVLQDVLAKISEKEGGIAVSPDYKKDDSPITMDSTFEAVFKNAPFLEAEFLFYHAILAEKKYFKPNSDKYDFYAPAKKDSILAGWENFIENLDQLIENKKQSSSDSSEKLDKKTFEDAMKYSLSANTSDLSQLNSKARIGYTIEDMNILHDDSDVLYEYFYDLIKEGGKKNHKNRRFDIICDNAGKELFSDLYLACYFLYNNIADEVVFHLKEYPFFVSDATKEDFGYLINAIQNEGTRNGSKKCLEYIREEKIRIKSHSFWTRPLCFKELKNIEDTEFLYDELCESNLIIVKGDLNYRRLVEDRNYSYTEKFSDVVKDVFGDVPIFAPRVLKSDVLIGISEAAYSYAKSTDILGAPADQKFKGNGKWAVMHFRIKDYNKLKQRSINLKQKRQPHIKSKETKAKNSEKAETDADMKKRIFFDKFEFLSFILTLVVVLVLIALLFISVFSIYYFELPENKSLLYYACNFSNIFMQNLNADNVKRIDFSLLLSGYAILLTGTFLIPRYFLRQETKLEVDSQLKEKKQETIDEIENKVQQEVNDNLKTLKAESFLLDGDLSRMTSLFLKLSDISFWAIGWSYHSLRRYYESEKLKGKTEILGFVYLLHKNIIIDSIKRIISLLNTENFTIKNFFEEKYNTCRIDNKYLSRFATLICSEACNTGEPVPLQPILRLIKDAADFEYELRYKNEIDENSEFYKYCDKIVKDSGSLIRFITLSVLYFPLNVDDNKNENFKNRFYPTKASFISDILKISDFNNKDNREDFKNKLETTIKNLEHNGLNKKFNKMNLNEQLKEIYSEENINYRTYFFTSDDEYYPMVE